MAYGLLTPCDVQVMERMLCLAAADAVGDAPIRFCEIGVRDGATARGIQAYLAGLGRGIDYVGFDSGRDMGVIPPFEHAQMCDGDSAETYLQIATRTFDCLVIDGCHCANHVMLDFLNFAPRVRVGGYVFCHDLAPRAQGKCDYQGHGPKAQSDFGTASRVALDRLGLLATDADAEIDPAMTGWRLLGPARTQRVDYCRLFGGWIPDWDWGGAAVFQRV